MAKQSGLEDLRKNGSVEPEALETRVSRHRLGEDETIRVTVKLGHNRPLRPMKSFASEDETPSWRPASVEEVNAK